MTTPIRGIPIDLDERRRCRVREFLGRSMDDTEADDALHPYVSEYQRSLKLLPAVPAFLARSVEIPKVIVTNGMREQQMQKLRAKGLEEHWSAVVARSMASC